MTRLKPALIATLLLCLSGCTLFDETEDPSNWTAQRYYEEAKAALDIGDYQMAIQHLEDLEIRHPFSSYTTQGQLEIAYAYYKFDEPESAIAAAERFIKLYPRNEHVDYAYYIIGLSNFHRGLTAMDFLLDLPPSKRDPKPALDSFMSFEQLISRYPDSVYVPDAKQRMIYLRNRLAETEMHAARYFVARGAHLAAINRAKYVIEHYPQSQAVPDALALMMTSYQVLHIDDLAQDTREILALNYPKHPSLDKTAKQH